MLYTYYNRYTGVWIVVWILKEQISNETCRPNIEELVDITTFTEMKNP